MSEPEPPKLISPEPPVTDGSATHRTIIALTKMSICLSRYALCMHDIDPHNEYEFGKHQSNYSFAYLFKTTLCKDDKPEPPKLISPEPPVTDGSATHRTIIALTKMSICLSRYALCMHDIDPHNEYEFGKHQSNYSFAYLFKTTLCKDDKSFFI